MISFIDKLKNSIKTRESNLCVGIDIDKKQFASNVTLEELKDYSFTVIDATRDFAAAYKPNLAFFEEWGSKGFIWLEELIEKIGNQHVIIADAKRGDIGNSAAHYANAFFKHFDCDAITVNPYMGEETITPFSTDSTKGVYVLCVTSNSSAGYIQNDTFKNVINLTNDMNENKNIGLVVGATDTHKMEKIRSLSNLPFLIPGIGAQGGDLENTVNINKEFMDSTLVNVSRSIIFADNKDSKSIYNAAKEFSEQMKKYCEQ
jgi:orotidine-5'-phosphate decarboxylase